MIPSITHRRSTRYFEDRPIPQDLLTEILLAGRQAPSPGNRQPWTFIVVSGEAKAGMISAINAGISRIGDGRRLSPAAAAGVRYTLRAMSEAPVTIFVINPFGRDPRADWSPQEKINELLHMQGIGAAVENMALAADDLGIGSLWIGHIFVAYDELMAWLAPEKGTIALALSLGYPARPPIDRPSARKPLADMVEYRS